jgi:hypothetical protein
VAQRKFGNAPFFRASEILETLLDSICNKTGPFPFTQANEGSKGWGDFHKTTEGFRR